MPPPGGGGGGLACVSCGGGGGGGGGVFLRIPGVGVPPGSPNPDPISDK